jgi:tricorn protease
MAIRAWRLAVLLVGTCLAHAAQAQGERTFMRMPTLHGQTIVFVAHDNLWAVDRAGGVARRLTSDPGQDSMPRFSPDGKWIAFTGNYQGNQDVYAIPAEGGAARRLTFHSDIVTHAPTRWGPDNMVLTWTPDSKNIVFLTRAVAWNSWYSRPFEVPVTGGLPVPMPLDRAGLMSFSPDGHTIAYNRIFRNFRTWKRYDGGLAQDIYTYDFDSKKLTQITSAPGTETSPMWVGSKIYYLSDNDSHRRANIWVHDLAGGADREITHFTDYDIDFPSAGQDAIVFQQGGFLWLLDLATEKLTRLDVRVPDDGTRTGERFVHAEKTLRDTDTAQQTDYALSPNGKRALFSARGDLFSVPEEHGVTRNLTETSNADEDHPAWSPDGSTIAYTTDASGGQQIALRPAAGGPEKQLTHFTEGFFYTPVFSPDGKSLAFSDGEHRLWVVGTDGSAPKQIAQNGYGEIHDQSWSPDGRYLAFSQARPTHLNAIWLHDMSTGQSVQISDGMEDDFAPVFSPDGKYLVFVSNRHENPTFSTTEMNVATLKTTGIYLAPLARDTASPFAPQSDEGSVEPPKKPESDKPKGWKPGAIKPIHIDIEGLMGRAVKLPIEPANIASLDVRDQQIFYLTKPPDMIEGALPGEKPALHVFNLETRKDAVVVTGAENYSLSADGQKLLYKDGSAFRIVDAKPGQIVMPGTIGHKPLALDGMRTKIDPPLEWAEMFENAWRLERDLFFNPKTNGIDWHAVHDAYAKLLPLVGSREDLNYLIGQVQGELGNSHTYVGGGDAGTPVEDVPTALLGADLAVDAASGRTVFARVLQGDNTRSDYRSPLTAPGIGVKTGDYLLAINGHELKAPVSAYSLLVGVQGQVTLTVAPTADGKRRDVVIEPLKTELSLREKSWIDHNRAIVDRLSGGRIAYVYLSNMESLGMEQFVRQFYPQMDKQALIVDDRWNGGGFIDEILLERLRRVLVGMSTNREHVPMTIPEQLLVGPKLCLINHYSASDGDIFPYYFRKYGLGPLLGTRTWGGVRGIRGNWTLLDGGYITIPEDSLYGLDSQWVIENHGVDPDIAIEDDPASIMADHDTQLEAAVKYLTEKLGANPHPLPPAPPLLPAYPPKP